MRDFATETQSGRVGNRSQMTLEALGQLARAVSAYPGRKNLRCPSKAFPSGVLASPGDSTRFTRDYLGLIQKYSGVSDLISDLGVSDFDHDVVAHGFVK